MSKLSWLGGLLILAMGLCGCAANAANAANAPDAAYSLPPLQPLWPSLNLKLGWNGQTYHVPPPALLPAAQIQTALRDDRPPANQPGWAAAALPGGHQAKIWIVYPKQAGQPLLMEAVDLWGPNGKLQIHQSNDPCWPNAPCDWIEYEPDGATPRLEVAVRQTGGRRWISQVTFYSGGRAARLYRADSDGVVYQEIKENPGGTRTTLHETAAKPG
jgi:hypothetical protein